MTAILVIGTPRSGTSCVAGILHHLGVPMGERLMPADEWNPAGYFQDEDFEDILHEAVGAWVFPDWQTSKPNLNGKFARQIRQLAAERSAQYPLWGVKSTRLVFFWNALKAGAGEMKDIKTQRPIEDSIASWESQTECGDGHEENPIRRMSRALALGAKQMNITPHLTVDYNELLSDTGAIVQQIADVAGVPVTQAAIDFVNADLRRFNIDG
jgi:hypothetical protein